MIPENKGVTMGPDETAPRVSLAPEDMVKTHLLRALATLALGLMFCGSQCELAAAVIVDAGPAGGGENHREGQKAPSQPDIATLVKQLGDKDVMIRQEAARALGRVGPDAIPALVMALGNENADVRESAANAIFWGKIRVPEAVIPLIANLKDQGFLGRAAAARALGMLRDTRAVGPLIQALNDRNPYVGNAVSTALAQIGAPAADALIDALKSGSPEVCSGAAKAIRDLKDARAVEPLIGIVRNTSLAIYVRRDAAVTLATMKATAAVEPLLAVLQEKNPFLRAAISSALADFDDPRATGALENALKQKELDVIAGAHAFYIRRGEPGTEQILEDALFKYGDASMAEALMNCGNEPLTVAGRAWAAGHGYTVTRNSNSKAHLRWGGQ
jgi:hypothetical protein